MSTFGCEIKPVKTRKPHRCETCCRVIPAGMKAYHTGGMWDGDWQNWYMCGFCHDNNVSASGEEISDEDFNNWLYEQDFAVCPHGCNGKRYSNTWEWSDDREDVVFECDQCGHKWTVHIGWGDDT